MDRIWQWTWDRFKTRYSWAIYVLSVCELLPVYLIVSCLVVAFERSDRYVAATAVTIGAVLVMVYVTNLPGVGGIRIVERWAAGSEVDRAAALDATYTWARDSWRPSGGFNGNGCHAGRLAALASNRSTAPCV